MAHTKGKMKKQVRTYQITHGDVGAREVTIYPECEEYVYRSHHCTFGTESRDITREQAAKWLWKNRRLVAKTVH